MTNLIRVVGFAYIFLGVSVAVYPDLMLSVDWATRSGLYIAGGMRIVVGIILMQGAPTSRFPRTLRVFGAIAMFAGLVLLVFPLEPWVAYMKWWMEAQLSLFRVVMAIAATLFGAFMVYAARPGPTPPGTP